MLLSEVFYLDRLINFSSGKPEGKKQRGGLAKEITETAVLAHTSTNTQLFLGHSMQRYAEREERVLSKVPETSLLVSKFTFLPCVVLLPCSFCHLPRLGAKQPNRPHLGLLLLRSLHELGCAEVNGAGLCKLVSCRAFSSDSPRCNAITSTGWVQLFCSGWGPSPGISAI